MEKAVGRVRDGFGTGLGIQNFENAGFWRLGTPKASISSKKCEFLAPEGVKKQYFMGFESSTFKP